MADAINDGEEEFEGNNENSDGWEHFSEFDFTSDSSGSDWR